MKFGFGCVSFILDEGCLRKSSYILAYLKYSFCMTEKQQKL
jgi:hypothetical protein